MKEGRKRGGQVQNSPEIAYKHRFWKRMSKGSGERGGRRAECV